MRQSAASDGSLRANPTIACKAMALKVKMAICCLTVESAAEIAMVTPSWQSRQQLCCLGAHGRGGNLLRNVRDMWIPGLRRTNICCAVPGTLDGYPGVTPKVRAKRSL